MIVGNPAWVACDVAWYLQDLDPFELVTGGDQGVGHGRDVRVDRSHRRGHLAEGAGDVRDRDARNEHVPIVFRPVTREPRVRRQNRTTRLGSTCIHPSSVTYQIRLDGGLLGTHPATTRLCSTRPCHCQGGGCERTACPPHVNAAFRKKLAVGDSGRRSCIERGTPIPTSHSHMTATCWDRCEITRHRFLRGAWSQEGFSRMSLRTRVVPVDPSRPSPAPDVPGHGRVLLGEFAHPRGVGRCGLTRHRAQRGAWSQEGLS